MLSTGIWSSSIRQYYTSVKGSKWQKLTKTKLGQVNTTYCLCTSSDTYGLLTIPVSLDKNLDSIPPKSNIAPEKGWLEDEITFWNGPFFKGYNKLQGCIPLV